MYAKARSKPMNKSGLPDPTAEQAIARVMKEQKKRFTSTEEYQTNESQMVRKMREQVKKKHDI